MTTENPLTIGQLKKWCENNDISEISSTFAYQKKHEYEDYQKENSHSCHDFGFSECIWKAGSLYDVCLWTGCKCQLYLQRYRQIREWEVYALHRLYHFPTYEDT